MDRRQKAEGRRTARSVDAWAALTCTRTSATLVQVAVVQTQTTQVVFVKVKELLSILKLEVAFVCQAMSSATVSVLCVDLETTRIPQRTSCATVVMM